MPLPSGTRLGHERHVGPLGAGGMGEVYKADDPRRGRDVGPQGAVQLGILTVSRECIERVLDPDYALLEIDPRPALNITLAFVTDPWGRFIELNEGLENIE